MATTHVLPPYGIYNDSDGTPLDGGYIYIGTVNLNPITDPIAVYWDSALTIPAAQPIRTSGGYPVRNGTPSKLYASQTSYSIVVQDHNAVTVYSSLSNYDTVSDLEVRLADSVNPENGAALVGRSLRQINSVAELRTVEGRYDGEQVFLVSYFSTWTAGTNGPVGGGILTWDASSTASDNSGNVFAVSGVTTGRWRRNGDQRRLKLEEWGAVPFDNTVDTGAVISAMSAYLTALGGGVIYTDGGTFYMSTTATLGSKVRVKGTGPGHTIFYTLTNTIDAFLTASDARYVSIESATIFSQAGIGASNAAIRNNATNGGARHRYIDLEINAFFYGHHCTELWWDNYLEDVRWNSCTYSFYHIGVGGLSINNLFVKCYSNEPTNTGVRLGPMKNSKFQSCNFGGHQTLTTTYVSVLGNAFSLAFESCNFELIKIAQDAGGIVVWSGANVTFESCTFVTNEPASGATQAFEIQARDQSIVRVYNCTQLQPGTNMRDLYSLNTARLIVGSNTGLDNILDLSTNKAIYTETMLTGSATGVKSGDLLTTGKGSAVTQFLAAQIPAASAYPSVAVSCDEKDSLGRVKLRFTNLTDGSANTAGLFNIDWLAR